MFFLVLLVSDCLSSCLLFTVRKVVLWFCDIAGTVNTWPSFKLDTRNFHTGVSWVYNSCFPHYFQVWYILWFQPGKLVFLNQALKQFHFWCQVPPVVTFLFFPHLSLAPSLWVCLWLIPLYCPQWHGAIKATYVQLVLKVAFTDLFFSTLIALGRNLSNFKLCTFYLSSHYKQVFKTKSNWGVA